MDIDFSDSKILTGIIAAITSILTVLILKPFVDKRFHLFKLREDFKYEQRKKIKEVLALNKVHLLKSCEALNHRLWNFSNNYTQGWHIVENDYTIRNYYIDSFTYRIISVFAWVKIIEDDLIYFDTTISAKEDIELIKFFRLFQETFCDLMIFDRESYDSNCATDHFFRNQFEEIACELIVDKKVISFSEFEKKLIKSNEAIEHMYKFLNGITKDEERLRWHRLQLFHLAIMAFLNKYGYDFQHTDKSKISKLKNRIGGYKLISNYTKVIERDRLGNQKDLKKIIKYAT